MSNPTAAEDWADWASVFRAGADRARGWSYSNDAQREAEILDAQAGRCEEIAREHRGNPPVTHDHYHTHRTPKGPVLHRHGHDHAEGHAMTEDELRLLRTYADGPRIWDAAAVVPGVYALADLGLIEPVPDPDQAGAYQLTDRGRLLLGQAMSTRVTGGR